MRNKKIIFSALSGIVIFLTLWVSWANFWWRYSVSNVDFEYKTVRAGRYEMDIPKSFELKFKGVWINGFEVVSLGKMSEASFQKMVEERKAAYQNGLDAEGITWRLLNYQETSSLKIIGKLSVRQHSTAKRRLYHVEAYTWRDGIVFRFDGSIKFKTEAEDLNRLERTAAALRAGPGPGFFFDGGHFPNVQNSEYFSVFVYDPEYDPKIRRFGIEFSASDEQRAAKDRQKPGGTSPRMRSVQIDGISGYEFRIATGTVYKTESTVINFIADIGNDAKFGAPARNIQLDLFKVDLSMNTPPYGPDEAAAIWKKLIETIHRR